MKTSDLQLQDLSKYALTELSTQIKGHVGKGRDLESQSNQTLRLSVKEYQQAGLKLIAAQTKLYAEQGKRTGWAKWLKESTFPFSRQTADDYKTLAEGFHLLPNDHTFSFRQALKHIKEELHPKEEEQTEQYEESGGNTASETSTETTTSANHPEASDTKATSSSQRSSAPTKHESLEPASVANAPDIAPKLDPNAQGGRVNSKLRLLFSSKTSPDDFQTPVAALTPLLPYLPKGKKIWEPACGKGNLVRAMQQEGFEVEGTDIKGGDDFFSWCPRPSELMRAVPMTKASRKIEADIIVTNPPYSYKTDFLIACYQLGIPFALLMPLTALEGVKRQECYRARGHGVDLIVLPKRLQFETPSGKPSHCWFPVAWFTWGLEPHHGSDHFTIGEIRMTKSKDRYDVKNAQKHFAVEVAGQQSKVS